MGDCASHFGVCEVPGNHWNNRVFKGVEKCKAVRRGTNNLCFSLFAKKLHFLRYWFSIPFRRRRSFQLKAESVNGEAINTIAKRVCIASRASRSATDYVRPIERKLREVSWQRGGGWQCGGNLRVRFIFLFILRVRDQCVTLTVGASLNNSDNIYTLSNKT